MHESGPVQMLLRICTISLVLATLSAAGDPSPLITKSDRPPNLETPVEMLDKDGVLTKNEHFFVRYHLANIPTVDAKTWRLEIKGDSVAKPISYSLKDLHSKFKQYELVALAYCAGNRRSLAEPHVPGVQWSYGAMGNARWRGVRLRDVLQAAGLKNEAVEIVADGADGPVLNSTPDFRKSIPLSKALNEDTLIALEMNGRPLPQDHGFPARLVVPGWVATYWVKHLVSLEAVSKPFDGYWMKTAYRVPKGKFPGDPFPTQEQPEKSPATSIVVNSLITNVSDGAKVKSGKDLVIRGLAWDGGSGIQSVEFSTDEGKTWKPAALEKDYGKYSWRRFHFTERWSDTGEKQVLTRATNKSGLTQNSEVIANPGGYHHNAIQKLKIVVE